MTSNKNLILNKNLMREKEIECHTGENKSEIPSVINCRQCVFETLCLAWNSKTQ